MKQHSLHVLCLQETKSKNTTQYVVDNYTFLTVSTADPNHQEHAGVGFVLSPTARRALLRTHPVSSRFDSITLLTASGEFSILNCYAPQRGRPEEERQEFFDFLHDQIDVVKSKGLFVVVGDFNARIQGRLRGEEKVLGPSIFGRGIAAIGDDSSNRQMLLDLCVANDLLVANTWFQHPHGRQATYKEPGTKRLPAGNDNWNSTEFAQLDFRLMPDACHNVYSKPRANLDSDHFPLHVHIVAKLGAKPRGSKHTCWAFDSATPEQVADMNREIERKLQAPDLPNMDISTKWDTLRQIYVDSLETSIPKQNQLPRKPWITEATLDLIRRRGQYRDGGDLEAVADLNRQIRRAAKQNKRAWLDTQLASGDWRPIINLKKPFRGATVRLYPEHKTQTTSTSDNATVFATHLAEVQWADAGPAQGLRHNAVIDTEPTISTTTISMAEVIVAIKQSKSGKRGGKDQIPNELFKNLQGEGLEALLQLFQACWDQSNSPAQWKTAQVVGIFKKGSPAMPSNYRPVSLLQSCYKLYARIITNRLTEGLDSHIRELQFGFRKGRSTAETIFLVGRLQDLVDAKRHQVLYLMFLDWAKAFDKIRPDALRLALARLKVPGKMQDVVAELVQNPLFEVLMGEDVSETYQQNSGIRQGCTLSPLLFILLQIVLFSDVQERFLALHPLAITPTIPFFDIEFADDTVLICRTQQQMQDLLALVQEEAAKYNLHLNKDKTKLIAYNTEQEVAFSDGTPLPKTQSIIYLGGLIDHMGRPGPKVRRRIAEARQVFCSLIRVWKHARLSTGKKLAIYKACVVTKPTLRLTDTPLNQLDAFHFKCLRSIGNIPTTWGAMQIGIPRVSNEEVRAQLNEILLRDELRLHQLKLLGHILRRPVRHPSRIVTFDRFLQPQTLGGPYRAGRRRVKWNEQLLVLASTIFNDHFYGGRGNERDIKHKILEVAENREWWSRVLSQTRNSWRRRREGHG